MGTVTTTWVNSALHPSGVDKSSTSFGWGKGGKVTAARWQVTQCDPTWHVISRSGVVTFHQLLYFAYFTLIYCTIDRQRQTDRHTDRENVTDTAQWRGEKEFPTWKL